MLVLHVVIKPTPILAKQGSNTIVMELCADKVEVVCLAKRLCSLSNRDELLGTKIWNITEVAGSVFPLISNVYYYESFFKKDKLGVTTALGSCQRHY